MQNNKAPQNLQSKFYEIVKVLAQTYPVFFEDPRLRRPLKHDIVQDIAADIANDPNHELRYYDIHVIEAVVHRYCEHAGYQQNCVAGTARVDLNGKQVGKVTAAEAREARIKASEGFVEIEKRKIARKKIDEFAETEERKLARSSAVPAFKTFTVDNTMTDKEMAASIVANAKSLQEIVLNENLAPNLRNEFLHSTCVLLSDEVRTLDARFTK